METRGRYVVIGAFVVAGFIGLIAFLLWFGTSQANRQFATYDILFDNVSGISRGSEVRFAGLGVGQVTSLALDRGGSGKVRTRIDVASQTPVRTGSVATLELQGVTGVGLVSISPGDPSQPLLASTVEGVPVISAGRSTLQSLTETAPAILDQALAAATRINDVLTAENTQRLNGIIANVESASAKLDRTLGSADATMAQVGKVAEGLGSLGEVATELSGKAGTLLDTTDQAVQDFAGLRTQVSAVLETAGRAIAAAEGAVTADLKPAIADLGATSARLRETADSLGPQATQLLSTWTGTGQKAAARLDEAQAVIASVKASADALDPAAVAKLNAAMDTLATEVPQITAQLRQTADALGPQLQQLVASWGGAGDKAQARLDEAQGLVADLKEGSARLAGLADTWTATGAKAGARLDEAQGLIASLRSTADALNSETMARLNGAIDRVAADLPLVTADLRSAAAKASGAFTTLSDTVGSANKPLNDFLKRDLPQFGLLAGDLRKLVATLDGVARGLQKGPARSILGTPAPEFRR